MIEKNERRRNSTERQTRERKYGRQMKKEEEQLLKIQKIKENGTNKQQKGGHNKKIDEDEAKRETKKRQRKINEDKMNMGQVNTERDTQ